jgi:predicted phosphohydrolase
MVRETLDWLVQTSGIEVVVVDVKFPVASSQQIVDAVAAALVEHGNVKLCIFSHISSMVKFPSLSHTHTNDSLFLFAACCD